MKCFIYLIIAITLSLLVPQTPWASSFYYEFQGGLSEIRGGSPYFGSDLVSPMSWGLGFNGTLAYNFSGSDIPAELHAGLHGRYSSGANGDISAHSLVGIYPLVRLQFSKAYIGAGATPLLWKRTAPAAGIEDFTFSTSAIAYLLEGGLLWAVTPLFSLGGVASTQFISEAGVMSPNPIAEITVLFRFYFGFSGSSGSRGSNEFRGWRYPFGNELRN